jgi:hypothetical protein
MKIFAPVPLRVAPSSAVRQSGSVQWKIASKRGLLRRFRHFIESSDWVERYFCDKWIDEVCIGALVISVLYFVPFLMPLFLK